MDRVGHAQLRGMAPIADEATDRRRRSAGPRPTDDPAGNGVLLRRHLRENALCDVIVAAPVGRALGIGELVEIMAARLRCEPMGDVIYGARIVDRVNLAAVKADRVQLGRGGRGGHDREEAQAQHPCEIGFADRGRSRRGLDHAGIRADPPVAQRVKEQRAGKPVLQTAGRMAALILQVQRDAGIAWQFEPDEVRVGRAVIVRLNPLDRLGSPGSYGGNIPIRGHYNTTP